jgi:hypothetical protein
MRYLLYVTLLIAGIADAATRVEIYDRVTQQVLPTYRYAGRTYVIGEPGHEYEIRTFNSDSRRTLAVTSVDGVNVISGETAAPDQSGYVADPYGSVTIAGWRKNLANTAAFYFTSLGDSYAARTGRPDNVGVIGVAVFRERVRCCVPRDEMTREKAAPSAPGAADSAALPSRRAEPQLGTGHGEIETNAAQYTQFERESSTPNELIRIYYDSRRNLLAQGIIPRTPRFAERLPQPFPGTFVPDP